MLYLICGCISLNKFYNRGRSIRVSRTESFGMMPYFGLFAILNYPFGNDYVYKNENEYTEKVHKETIPCVDYCVII